MTRVHVLKVFAGPDGRGGNPLGVITAGYVVPRAERQALAARLAYPETVFVDDPAEGVIQILTPRRELAFAGHPTVGTGWLLARLGQPADVLRPPAGEVPTWRADGGSWVRARAAWIHRIDLEQLPTPEAVEALDGPPEGGSGSWYPWAWIDEAAGILRSRYFFPAGGITEDEATGSAAVLMGDHLARALEVHQGVGSVIHVQPGPDGTVEIGGAVEIVEIRELV
jgi:predicted PhzF superfamily epimerase YddE/YHI9